MKKIFIHSERGQHRGLTFGGWTRALLSVCLLGIPTIVGACNSWLVNFDKKDGFNADAFEWGASATQEKSKLEKSRGQNAVSLNALVAEIANLHIVRNNFDLVSGPSLPAVAENFRLSNYCLNVQNYERNHPGKSGSPHRSFDWNDLSLTLHEYTSSSLQLKADSSKIVQIDRPKVVVNAVANSDAQHALFKSKLEQLDGVYKKDHLTALTNSIIRSAASHVRADFFKNGRVIDTATYVHTASR